MADDPEAVKVPHEPDPPIRVVEEDAVALAPVTDALADALAPPGPTVVWGPSDWNSGGVLMPPLLPADAVSPPAVAFTPTLVRSKGRELPRYSSISASGPSPPPEGGEGSELHANVLNATMGARR